MQNLRTDLCNPVLERVSLPVVPQKTVVSKGVQMNFRGYRPFTPSLMHPEVYTSRACSSDSESHVWLDQLKPDGDHAVVKWPTVAEETRMNSCLSDPILNCDSGREAELFRYRAMPNQTRIENDAIAEDENTVPDCSRN